MTGAMGPAIMVLPWPAASADRSSTLRFAATSAADRLALGNSDLKPAGTWMLEAGALAEHLGVMDAAGMMQQLTAH